MVVPEKVVKPIEVKVIGKVEMPVEKPIPVPVKQETVEVIRKEVVEADNSQIATIKSFLIDNLELIKKGDLTVDKANAINQTVQTFINVAKTELEYMKYSEKAKTLDVSKV